MSKNHSDIETGQCVPVFNKMTGSLRWGWYIRSIKWILWRLLGEDLKGYDTIDSFRSELDYRPIKWILWRLLGEGLKGQSWIEDLSSGSFGVSSVKVSKISLGQSWIVDPSSGSFGVSSVKVSKIPLGQSWIVDPSSGSFDVSSVKVSKDYRSIKWILWRLLGEGLKDSFRSELDYRSIKRFLLRLLGEVFKVLLFHVFGPKLDNRNALRLSGIKFWQARLGRFPRELWDFFGLVFTENGSTLLGVAKLSVPNTRPLLLQSCDLPSANDGRLVKATRSAIEIASVPTDSTSRNNRFCPGAKLRVSTKASDFSREIEGHFCGISL
ncbi:hypothetical protein BDC45DRAFT_552849 [Circinella umbellata]|nr:hypothetical protein BDC45DRAFT_552849 [Circinella umbellata]